MQCNPARCDDEATNRPSSAKLWVDLANRRPNYTEVPSRVRPGMRIDLHASSDYSFAAMPSAFILRYM